MNLPGIRAFFLWCTIINGTLLILSTLIIMLGGDRIYRLHGRWFPTSRETFNAVLYAFLGLFKLLVIVFNLVPYLALVILK